MADLDLFLLNDGVEEDLRTESLLAGDDYLCAVLVVFEAVLVLEVTVNFVFNKLLGNGDLDGLEQLVNDLVASLCTLAEGLGTLDLLLEVGLEFLDGVELTCHLREVVVGLRKLALLDGEQRNADDRRLALVVSTEEYGFEGG